MKSFIAASVILAATQNVFAQELPTVENYQIQSQYGPEVAVLNPVFDKNGAFEFSFSASYSPMSSLYDYAGIGAGATYHINRRHSAEFYLQYNLLAAMSAFTEEKIRDKCAPPCNFNTYGVDVPRTIVSAAYGFTPYYTKMHITDMSVVHMDINAFVGPAAVLTEQLRFNDKEGDSNFRIGALLGAGVRILSRDRWGFRVELRNLIHKAKNVDSEEYVNDLQLTAGVSIFLDKFRVYND